MESILNIDLKNNPDLLEDFDGISPGDLIKVSACFKVSELSDNRLSAPLDEVYDISLKESDDEEYDDEEEEEDSEDEDGTDEEEA
jgi:hypothetical protein